MKRFFKFLILVTVVINLAFVFVFDGRIPSNLSLPFLYIEAESEGKVAEKEEIQPVDKEETAEVETEIQTEEPEEEELEAEETEAEVLPRCRITSAGGSNVRSGPGTGFGIVTAYPFDTVFTITGEPEIGWYPILAEDGTEGYIFENQIEILDDIVAEDDILLTDEAMQ